MSDKKNIVIKVKYPNPNKTQEQIKGQGNQITEWNIKRVLWGVCALLLLLAISYLIFKPEDADKTEESVQAPAPLVKQEPIKPLPPAVSGSEVKLDSVKPSVSVNEAVVRSLLTNKVDRNEPGKIISTPLKISKKEALGIYYFAELRGMKGKIIYHEWYLNDQLVSRKKVNISADPWRTASRQLITYTINNDWKVRLTDEAGGILNEKKFNLELK